MPWTPQEILLVETHPRIVPATVARVKIDNAVRRYKCVGGMGEPTDHDDRRSRRPCKPRQAARQTNEKVTTTGAASVERSTMTLGCSGKWSAGRFSAIAGATLIAFTKNPRTEIQSNCSKCEKKLGEIDNLVNETLASTPSGLLRNRRNKTTYNDEQHPSAAPACLGRSLL
ncbi:hypothetical protein ACVW1C_000039 [Bradyrhizobium sp. USDA 4011]